MEKKAIIPMKERFWPVFPRIIDYENPQATIYKGPKSYSVRNCPVGKVKFLGPKRSIKTNFLEKKVKFPVKKDFLTFNSAIIEYDKRQKTFFGVKYTY